MNDRCSCRGDEIGKNFQTLKKPVAGVVRTMSVDVNDKPL